MWDKIACIWHIVKGHYSAEIPCAYGAHMSELEQAASILSKSLTYLSFDRLLLRTGSASQIPDSQAKANRATLMYRLMPALKTLNDHIDQLDLGPVEGFALIDLEVGPDAIARNGYGYCVYSTEEEVEKILNHWKQEDELYKDEGTRYRRGKSEERLSIRKVRISKEGGIEFTGESELNIDQVKRTIRAWHKCLLDATNTRSLENIRKATDNVESEMDDWILRNDNENY